MYCLKSKQGVFEILDNKYGTSKHFLFYDEQLVFFYRLFKLHFLISFI